MDKRPELIEHLWQVIVDLESHANMLRRHANQIALTMRNTVDYVPTAHIWQALRNLDGFLYDLYALTEDLGAEIPRDDVQAQHSGPGK